MNIDFELQRLETESSLEEAREEITALLKAHRTAFEHIDQKYGLTLIRTITTCINQHDDLIKELSRGEMNQIEEQAEELSETIERLKQEVDRLNTIQEIKEGSFGSLIKYLFK